MELLMKYYQKELFQQRQRAIKNISTGLVISIKYLHLIVKGRIPDMLFIRILTEPSDVR
jgi:hypothetical protein